VTRSLQGRRAFVTGGSAGIGLEVARQLIAGGAHVVIAARGRERLEAAREELAAARTAPDQIVACTTLDVRRPESVAAAAVEALELLGGVDLLVNNAGAARPRRSWETSEDDLEEMLEVNYKGMVRVAQAFLPQMVARREGHIVNVSSLLGLLGMYGYGAYCASKFAIAGYSHCLRQELIEHGVRVSVFYPPTTRTPGLEEENRDKPPETWAIESGSNTTASADRVARALLDGVRRERYEIPGNFEARYIAIAQRLAPGIVRRSLDRALRRFIAADGAGAPRPAPGAPRQTSR
jgi:3-dehydrosphinganine reductase